MFFCASNQIVVAVQVKNRFLVNYDRSFLFAAVKLLDNL